MTFSADSVSLELGENTVLSRVSLKFSPGLVHVVVGPNGAGKSSLLKLFSGDCAPSSGSIKLDLQSLCDHDQSTTAQRIAVLPQQSQLNFPFSVYEVVALGRYPHNTGKIKDDEVVAAVLSAVGGLHLQDRLYTSLSGGEQQRIHLARVLAQVWLPSPQGSRYLLLDEPTAALDLAHQHLILKLAVDMAKQGLGVLSVLHDLNLAAQYADVITLLSEGRVVAQGVPSQVLSVENIQSVYGVNVEIIPHPSQSRFLIISE